MNRSRAIHKKLLGLWPQRPTPNNGPNRDHPPPGASCMDLLYISSYFLAYNQLLNHVYTWFIKSPYRWKEHHNVMIWMSSCFGYCFCLFIIFIFCLILFIVIIFNSQILSVIMQSCSSVTSLCFCVIWAQGRPCLVTLRLFLDSWHFLNASFVSRFLGFPLFF